MTDYIVCVRNIEKGAFANEPGTTYFLAVPDNKENIAVSHKVSKKSEWFKTVLAELDYRQRFLKMPLMLIATITTIRMKVLLNRSEQRVILGISEMIYLPKICF